MYNNKLAVALKSSGKVLREFGETVYVPFGSEYSILIKNLNSVRALVTVSVDGTDAGDGDQFVVNANDSLELERFLKDGNQDKGNRFKFIERTENIEDHRGVGVEDGLIRVEFQFEKPVVRHYYPTEIWHYPQREYYGSGYDDIFGKGLRNIGSGDVSFTSTNAVGDGEAHINFSSSVNANDNVEIMSDAGITVPGSVSDQKFTTVSSFPVEDEKHVVVLKMLGETADNKRVRKAVTVKAKIECSTCGKKNKANGKFCSECGTSLTII